MCRLSGATGAQGEVQEEAEGSEHEGECERRDAKPRTDAALAAYHGPRSAPLLQMNACCAVFLAPDRAALYARIEGIERREQLRAELQMTQHAIDKAKTRVIDQIQDAARIEQERLSVTRLRSQLAAVMADKLLNKLLKLTCLNSKGCLLQVVNNN